MPADYAGLDPRESNKTRKHKHSIAHRGGEDTMEYVPITKSDGANLAKPSWGRAPPYANPRDAHHTSQENLATHKARDQVGEWLQNQGAGTVLLNGEETTMEYTPITESDMASLARPTWRQAPPCVTPTSD